MNSNQHQNINTMREQIQLHLDEPGQLEKMYRENKATFKRAFGEMYPDIREKVTAQVWNERLRFEPEEISWGTKKELIVVILISFVAGIIAKIPDLLTIDADYFYPRNIGFIIFPALTAYFIWKQQLPLSKILAVAGMFILSLLYMNMLPVNENSDTFILSCIHMPIFLWAVSGFTFAGNDYGNFSRRLDYLRYNGDLVVMTTIILISGGLLTAVTFGLFDLIDIKIEEFYFKNVVIWGLAAAPVIGTFLVQSNPQLVSKVSPIIARVFTPLVLLTLLVYLGAVIYTGKDPYNDREFLMIFNILLIGVMAIIVFSVAEISKSKESKTGTILLSTLSLVTIIVNAIALSAILFRITEWGITPNRLAVLGGNLLILGNLLMVTYTLFKSLKSGSDLEKVEDRIAVYLPVYAIWTMIVTFIFPVIFSFK